MIGIPTMTKRPMPRTGWLTWSKPSSIRASAVVQVGNRKGRGFIVRAAHDERYVLTAAHCLPRWRYPRPHLANGINELTFSNFLGPLDAKHGTIWAELGVLNLIDDIAVFGSPDNQELYDEADQYEQFTTVALPVSVRQST
jgi:hypothetical protein